MRPPSNSTLHGNWSVLKPSEVDHAEIHKGLGNLIKTHRFSRSYQRHSLKTLKHLMKPGTREGDAANLWRGQMWKRIGKNSHACAFLLKTKNLRVPLKDPDKVHFILTVTSPNHPANRPLNQMVADARIDLNDLNELCCELRGQGAEVLEILNDVYFEIDVDITELNGQVHTVQMKCPTDDPDLQNVFRAAVQPDAQYPPYIVYDEDSPFTLTTGNGQEWHDQWLGEEVYRWVLNPRC